MSSKREEVLQALYERLSALTEVDVRRNEVLPLKIPASGLVVLRDGNIGEPLVLLSPPRYLFQHRAEIEVLMQKVSPTDELYPESWRVKKVPKIAIAIFGKFLYTR